MYEQGHLVCCRAERIISELGNCIDYLFAESNMNMRYCLYCVMKCKIDELQFLNGLKCSESVQPVPQPLPKGVQNPTGQPAIPQQTTFTLEQLAQYNGKNGKPAYVAVNGTVYDVTDNAGWAAATHFGLSAGKDLSGEFASCHAGQPLLNRLKVIGRLVL